MATRYGLRWILSALAAATPLAGHADAKFQRYDLPFAGTPQKSFIMTSDNPLGITAIGSQPWAASVHARITQAWDVFKGLKLDAPPSERAEAFGMKAFSVDAYREWLGERLKRIVEIDVATDSIEEMAVGIGSTAYPNPGVPLRTTAQNEAILKTLRAAAGNAAVAKDLQGVQERQAVVAGLNLGAAIYLMGKFGEKDEHYSIPAGTRMALRLEAWGGKGLIEVDSPRAGIFGATESFFSEEQQRRAEADIRSQLGEVNATLAANGLPTLEESKVAGYLNSVVNLMMVETLAHEARHGDGSGADVTFMHQLCPFGHPMELLGNCDATETGSHSVGRALYASLSAGCRDGSCDPLMAYFYQLRKAEADSWVLRTDIPEAKLPEAARNFVERKTAERLTAESVKKDMPQAPVPQKIAEFNKRLGANQEFQEKLKARASFLAPVTMPEAQSAPETLGSSK